MRNARTLSLMVVLALLVCLFQIAFAVSQNATIQSQGQILYAPAPMLQPQLQVNGLYLEDGLGNRVRLKGMQVAWNERMKQQGTTGITNSPDESWFTVDDVQRMKNAGANCLEIHTIGLPELMPTKNVPNEVFFTTWVDTWANWCTQNQVYCILNIRAPSNAGSLPSWLWEGLYSTPQTQADYDAIIRDFFNVNVVKQDSNRLAFLNLWEFMANRYKDNPYVMFGLMNEPFNFVDTVDDATKTALGQSYSTFMGQVIDGIRNAGAQQLIFTDCPFLFMSSGYAVQPINKANIVWEIHQYITSYDNLQNFQNNVNYDVSVFATSFGKPVFIGEYGFDPPTVTHTTYSSTWQSLLASQVSYLDSKSGIVGRQFHCWDFMYGEHCAYSGESDFGSSESSYIIQTVLG